MYAYFLFSDECVIAYGELFYFTCLLTHVKPTLTLQCYVPYCLDLVDSNTYFMILIPPRTGSEKLGMGHINFKERCIGMKPGIENDTIYI